MKIAQIIPGTADNFYCENCLRDVALLKALQELGHDVTMLPMYLPVRIDQAEPTAKAPVFFGGINVYLQQKSALFRRSPRWIDRLFDWPGLLKWLARRSNMTAAKDLGEMTVSMLRGPEGRQRKEFERLVDWLALPQHKPDIVFLSNILLAGLAAAIKAKLAIPILCFLQDEDGFLDGLAHPYSERAWELLSHRTEDIDLFISVSKYYAGVMSQRLNLDADKLHVVYPGISLDGFEAAEAPPQVPTIGYLSRMCPSRGLDTLVDAFIELKEDARLKNVRLRISGGKNPGDEVFVEQLCQRLTENGCIDNVEFLPDFDRTDRQAFLQTLSVLSVPEKSPIAFGLYVLEALAAAVPVVQPAHGAFPELVEKTGGGLLYEPNNSKALAEMLRKLLLEPALARAMGEKAGKAMLGSFSVEQTAAQIMSMCQQTTERFQ